MEQRNWPDMAEELAFLKEAGLDGLDWKKISEDLAFIEAELAIEHMLAFY